MTKIILISLAALAIVTVTILGFRGQTSPRPPLQGFWDMADQRKYKPQAESPFFADGRTMRLPPAGAVAWGRGAAVPDEAFLQDDEAACSLQAFPGNIKVDEQLLARGQKQFSTYCSTCHGYTGSGNGITTQYGMIVPSYHTERARTLPVGEIYRIITEGRGLMPPYGTNVKPADRFAIIAYVRALQVARMGDVNDVTDPVTRDRMLRAEAR